MRNKELSCPNCGEFIGKKGGLTECPICGASLENEEN